MDWFLDLSVNLNRRHAEDDQQALVNCLEFTEVTFTLDKKTKDTLRIEGFLKQMTIIDGIPCYGNIRFAGDWELKDFTLADTHTFGEYTFPKDTYIGLNVDRFDLKTCYLVVAGADSVNTCKFSSNQLINGLLCDSIEDVIFTTDWNLKACILGDDDTIAGNVLNKGTLAVFGKSGSIYIYCLYDPIIQDYHCSGTNYRHLLWSGGGGTLLYPNGHLHLFKPIEDIEVQGIFCKQKCIWLYESGQLKRCTSAEDQTINGVLYEKNFTLKFDEEGNITESYKDKFF
ncbi:MAG: hypothetical protein HQ542_13265 [Bacteroidia bacterium]|nr:hypothetical protein [Bacteroidia bacterium]